MNYVEKIYVDFFEGFDVFRDFTEEDEEEEPRFHSRSPPPAECLQVQVLCEVVAMFVE